MTTTPAPAAPSLLPGEDTGAFDGDGLINTSAPTLTGQALPGVTLILRMQDDAER